MTQRRSSTGLPAATAIARALAAPNPNPKLTTKRKPKPLSSLATANPAASGDARAIQNPLAIRQDRQSTPLPPAVRDLARLLARMAAAELGRGGHDF